MCAPYLKKLRFPCIFETDTLTLFRGKTELPWDTNYKTSGWEKVFLPWIWSSLWTKGLRKVVSVSQHSEIGSCAKMNIKLDICFSA